MSSSGDAAVRRARNGGELPMRYVLPLIAVLLLAACNTKPLNEGAGPFQITEVVVTMKPGVSGGTPNFPEAIRVAVQNEAYRFSEEGREKRLEVQVTGVQLYDPMMTILISGNSFVSATCTLYNVETGAAEGTFDAGGAVAKQSGLLGAMINPMLISVYEDEQQLAQSLALYTLTKIYGSAHRGTVAGRVATQQAVANYPVSYEELERKASCAALDARNQQGATCQDQKKEPEPLPEHCADFGYEIEPS